MSLQVSPRLADPDQLGHDLLDGLRPEPGERKADQGRVPDPERPSAPGVREHPIQPLGVVHQEDHAHPTLVRSGLRVANSRHAGMLAVDGDKRGALGCLYMRAAICYTAEWRWARVSGPPPIEISEAEVVR